MAVSAVERAVVGDHELGGINEIVGIHPFFDISCKVFVEIREIYLSVALQACFVPFGNRYGVIGILCLQEKGNENNGCKEQRF
jgi:hypothetical protein